MNQRRHFMRLASAFVMGTLLAAPLAVQARDQDGAVVAAPKIIEALSAKDVVLDRPGQVPRRGQPARRDPSINLQVQFTFDSAELMPQGKRQLDELAMALNHNTLMVSGFELAGHTDRVGEADYNVMLSLQRADAVRTYLAQVHGVSPSRLQTVGYGFARLLDPAHPTAAINRRVEVRRIGNVRAPMPGGEAADGRLVPPPK
ncbi:MAG: OmpA family protein [Pseudomonadota bacterium]